MFYDHITLIKASTKRCQDKSVSNCSN